MQLDMSNPWLNPDIIWLFETPTTVFGRGVRFGGVTFTQGADFVNATFTQSANFEGVTFTQNADFSGATFTQSADFGGATFTQNANFGSAATFTQSADFDRATFMQDAFFAGATFTQSVNFKGATFTQDANFEGATFTQGADFKNADAKRTLSFKEAKPSGRLRLSETRFGPEARLSFEDINLRPGGYIELTIDQIGRWRRQLIQEEDSKYKHELASAASQYNRLRDNFRALPSTDEEEDRCHYKYMDLRRRASDWSLPRRLFDLLILKWCWGYGVYTHRIVGSMVLVVLMCGLVYGIFGGPSTIKNYYVPAGQHAEATQVRVVLETDFSPWYFSVITFTTIGYGDYAPLGWLRLVAGAEGVIGLFLMALFTVSFARKFIR